MGAVTVTDPRKRAAIESPSALIEREATAGVPARRPASTALGSFFVLSRGLAGLLWLGAFALFWPEIARSESLTPEDAALLGWFVAAITLAGVLVLLVLGWLIWRGSNWARILVMLGLTLSIMSAAVGYFTMGEQITIRTTLVVVALDILVLLALSSRDSRAWARRPRGARGIASAQHRD